MILILVEITGSGSEPRENNQIQLWILIQHDKKHLSLLVLLFYLIFLIWGIKAFLYPQLKEIEKSKTSINKIHIREIGN